MVSEGEANRTEHVDTKIVIAYCNSGMHCIASSDEEHHLHVECKGARPKIDCH